MQNRKMYVGIVLYLGATSRRRNRELSLRAASVGHSRHGCVLRFCALNNQPEHFQATRPTYFSTDSILSSLFSFLLFALRIIIPF